MRAGLITTTTHLHHALKRMHMRPTAAHKYCRRCMSNNDSDKDTTGGVTPLASDQAWSEEWRSLGLGARLPERPDSRITNLLFVQTGFGVDQHGDRTAHGATKASVRAVRNAIEFNSIPGVIEAVPGGRQEMLIKVKLGVPPLSSDIDDNNLRPMNVDLAQVAKVFPYGRLLPIDVDIGGLSFATGRIVTELGDEDDMAVCVAACVSIGYDNGVRDDGKDGAAATHTTYSTKDGY